MAERARPTHAGGAPQPVLSLTAAQGLARPGEAIVALNQFEDELAIWFIRNDHTSLVMRPIRRIDAERLVARQQEEIRIEARHPDASAALFDEIVRPLAAELRGVTRIAVVPDTTFQDASFAAFWDRSKSRFLVEDMTIASAPNVSVLAASAGDRSRAIGEPLIVSGEAQEPTARAIASTYRAPHMLIGASATRERFLADAPKSNIVHLTVPAHPNRAYPSLSRLVLSDEPGKRYSGAVLGRDIANRPMPVTRLVVLDDVRNSDSYRREGSFNLARAFLAAGVPAVLGTLPGADESKTRELMVAFHVQMAGEASAGEALTRLQRNVLGSNGRRIGAWGALVMYGSDR
jgi:CHAT domain-containing protein